MILVGNKIDMEDERKVTTEEGSEVGRYYKTMFMETSAKTGENVNEVFSMITESIMKKKNLMM